MQPAFINGAFVVCGAVIALAGAVGVEVVRDSRASRREKTDRVARYQVEALTRVQEQAKELVLTIIRYSFAVRRRQFADSRLSELGPVDVAEDEEFVRLGDLTDIEAFEELAELEKPEILEKLRERTKRAKESTRRHDRRSAKTDEVIDALDVESKATEALFVAKVELAMLATRVLNPEVAERAEMLCALAEEAITKIPEAKADWAKEHVMTAQLLHLQLQELAGLEIRQRLQS